MFDYRFFSRIDFRMIIVVCFLMTISFLVISSMTNDGGELFWTNYTKSQMKWYVFGWIIFFISTILNYQKIREWTWGLYILMVLMLIGLYFVPSVNHVHRWYRIPGIGMNVQPSEYTKLIVVLTLGWFLEKNAGQVHRLSTAMQILIIVGVPFVLILKQPDLGTALVLCPITLVMCYIGGVHKTFLNILSVIAITGFCFMVLLHLGFISHEKMKPFFTKFLKEYQYERLNPHSYHQKASQTAIAIGGVTGSGWNQSEFSSRKWLPAAHTDSVFSAYVEEFGFVGALFLLFLLFLLTYLSFQVTYIAKDLYGKLLSAGLAVYLSMHILMNIAMMCALLPISGVPLILITYGGSSILTTMTCLGILQSIYSRRFMF